MKRERKIILRVQLLRTKRREIADSFRRKKKSTIQPTGEQGKQRRSVRAEAAKLTKWHEGRSKPKGLATIFRIQNSAAAAAGHWLRFIRSHGDHHHHGGRAAELACFCLIMKPWCHPAVEPFRFIWFTRTSSVVCRRFAADSICSPGAM